jgi:hypothetical protein
MYAYYLRYMPDCEQDRGANFGCYLSRRLCITTSVKEKSGQQKLQNPFMKGAKNEGYKETM